MPSTILNLKIVLKAAEEKKDMACSNSVTICSEMNVNICPDNISLIKHRFAKNALQILFNGECYTHNYQK